MVTDKDPELHIDLVQETDNESDYEPPFFKQSRK